MQIDTACVSAHWTYNDMQVFTPTVSYKFNVLYRLFFWSLSLTCVGKKKGV